QQQQQQLNLLQQPSQYQQYLQQQQAAYVLPTPSLYGAEYSDLYASQPHFSPLMTSYSDGTSPSALFSPLPIFPASDQALYTQSAEWNDAPKPDPPVHKSSTAADTSGPIPLYAPSGDDWLALHAQNWNSFAMQGFSNATPPTPETFSTSRQPPVMAQAHDSSGEPEDDGEILVGMGLYDTPGKVDADPQLDNYRSTVSSLLGAAAPSPEPQGKGLKLEETWEPPAKEDAEADEEDDDDQEEGEGGENDDDDDNDDENDDDDDDDDDDDNNNDDA
ncbi:hypothetical protein E4U22_000996, partial [Claviceps purpurea]